MPTFIFYRNKAKIDSLRGADQNALEEKVKKWGSEGGDGEDSEECVVKGHVSRPYEYLHNSNNCLADTLVNAPTHFSSETRADFHQDWLCITKLLLLI